MRVLQINSVCGFGSTGRIVTDLYDVLESEGHECCIAYGRGLAPKEYNTIKIGNKIDFYSHVLKTRLFDSHGFGSTRATKNFINQIEEYNPDIIHIHNIHGYYLNVEMFFDYLSTLEIPIIWLLHDQWAFSGHSAYFELDLNEEVPQKNLLKSQIKDYPKSWLVDNSEINFIRKKELFTKCGNMTIVTPSNWLLKLVKKSYLSKYDGIVINNGIDLDVFKPFESNFKENNNFLDKKIILGVASIWEERKGLKFFNMLAEELPDEYQIVLVGIDNKTKKNLNKKIFSINRTTNLKELAEIYSCSDMFINPTLEDNFPTTNLEALACGTPVITFDTGGSGESLDGICGIVVEKGDINKLIQEIQNPFVSNINQLDCVKRSRMFNKNERYKDYIDLYLSLMS